MSETIEDVAEATEKTEEEAQSVSEIEELASEMGWAPEDDWRGDPNKWVDAKTFIKTGPEIYKSTLSRQDGEMSEMKKTLDEFKEFSAKSEERAYKRALAELQQKQREAVVEGDTEAFDRVAAAMKDLEPPQPVKAAETNPDTDPHFVAFQAANPWYGPDGDYQLTLAAEEAARVIGRKYQGAAFYEKIAETIRKQNPDKFSNGNRRAPARVEGGGDRKAPKQRGKTFADLPADAKAACERFVKQGLMEKDEYVQQYFEDEA